MWGTTPQKYGGGGGLKHVSPLLCKRRVIHTSFDTKRKPTFRDKNKPRKQKLPRSTSAHHYIIKTQQDSTDMYINKYVLKRPEPRSSMCLRTVLPPNKGTSYTKIGICSCYKYRNISDFQPQNLTPGLWQKSLVLVQKSLRWLNKSGRYNYLFNFFSTQLKKSIQLDAAWANFTHRHSLGFMPQVSPQ